MLRVTVLLIALFSFPVPFYSQGAHQPAHGVLNGSLIDNGGAAIQAFVLIHSDRAGNPINKALAVSEYGEFKTDLSPGLYDVFIAFPGYKPVAKLVEIKPGKRATLKLVMEIDEEHYKGTFY
ncbi:MAG TPA: hypothetical protein VKB38_06970 [Terracidiphilus sp.]|nr:hypothetical protein [Terracidiphilus sp.]